MTSMNALLTTKTAMYILAAGFLSNGLGILLAPEMAHTKHFAGELTDAMYWYLMMHGIRETFLGFLLLAVALNRDSFGTEAARAYFVLGMIFIFGPLQIYTMVTSPGLNPAVEYAQQGVGELTDAMHLYLMRYGMQETFLGFLAVALTRDSFGTEAARAYFLLGISIIFSPLQIFTVVTSPGLNPDFRTAALAVQGFFAIYLPAVEYCYFRSSSTTTTTTSSGKKNS